MMEENEARKTFPVQHVIKKRAQNTRTSCAVSVKGVSRSPERIKSVSAKLTTAQTFRSYLRSAIARDIAANAPPSILAAKIVMKPFRPKPQLTMCQALEIMAEFCPDISEESRVEAHDLQDLFYYISQLKAKCWA